MSRTKLPPRPQEASCGPPARAVGPAAGPTPVKLMAVALAAATLIAFWPVLSNGFVDVDDNLYLFQNDVVRQGLSWRGISWALAGGGETSNWHPVTWISHMADVSLFGLDPGRHHAVSLLIHTANALLAFAALLTLTGAPWRSLAAAAVFALHPTRVESVAWASERKDVLCALFVLLSLLAYVRGARGGGRRWLTAALLLFALALMSKPMAVTFPFVLLLLDWWPLGRFAGGASRASVWLEKLPFLALSAASSWLTWHFQQTGGATQFLRTVTLPVRASTAAVAVVKYVGLFFWPRGLAVLYPHPLAHPAAPVLAAVLSLLLAVTAAAAWLGLRGRGYAPVGWLWFGGMLVPVLGIVQVGAQEMADRYTYLPYIGLAVATVWGLAEALSRQPRAVLAGRAAALLAAVLLVCLTHRQAAYWRNSETLFTRALAVTSDNYLAHYDLAYYYLTQHQAEKAGYHFSEAIAVYSYHREAYLGLGMAFSLLGRYADEAETYRTILRADPTYHKAWNNLAAACESLGLYEEASAAAARAKATRDRAER